MPSTGFILKGTSTPLPSEEYNCRPLCPPLPRSWRLPSLVVPTPAQPSAAIFVTSGSLGVGLFPWLSSEKAQTCVFLKFISHRPNGHDFFLMEVVSHGVFIEKKKKKH